MDQVFITEPEQEVFEAQLSAVDTCITSCQNREEFTAEQRWVHVSTAQDSSRRAYESVVGLLSDVPGSAAALGLEETAYKARLDAAVIAARKSFDCAQGCIRSFR